MKLISALFKAVFGIFSKLFGSFSWSPPPWVDFLRNFSSNIKSLASRITAAVSSLIKKQPKPESKTMPVLEKTHGISFKRLGSALAIVFVIFALVMWYGAHRRGLIQVSGATPHDKGENDKYDCECGAEPFKADTMRFF